jgi:hypothetical protein
MPTIDETDASLLTAPSKGQKCLTMRVGPVADYRMEGYAF